MASVSRKVTQRLIRRRLARLMASLHVMRASQASGATPSRNRPRIAQRFLERGLHRVGGVVAFAEDDERQPVQPVALSGIGRGPVNLGPAVDPAEIRCKRFFHCAHQYA
jgi:hypothetical protein